LYETTGQQATMHLPQAYARRRRAARADDSIESGKVTEPLLVNELNASAIKMSGKTKPVKT
jgi:hypothetical protein